MSFDKQMLAVLGLAMALPSSILAVAGAVYYLIEEEMISDTTGLLIILAVIFNIFFLMFRHLRKNKSQAKDDQ